MSQRHSMKESPLRSLTEICSKNASVSRVSLRSKPTPIPISKNDLEKIVKDNFKHHRSVESAFSEEDKGSPISQEQVNICQKVSCYNEVRPKTPLRELKDAENLAVSHESLLKIVELLRLQNQNLKAQLNSSTLQFHSEKTGENSQVDRMMQLSNRANRLTLQLMQEKQEKRQLLQKLSRMQSQLKCKLFSQERSNTQIKSLQEQIRVLQQKHQSMASRSTQLQNELQFHRQNQQTLLFQLQVQQRSQNQMQTLQQQVFELTSRLKESEQKGSSGRRREAMLEQRVRAVSGENEELRKSVQEKQKELADVRQSSRSQRSSLMIRQLQGKSFELLSERITDLTSQQSKKDQQLSSLHQVLRDKQRELDSVKQLLAQLSEEDIFKEKSRLAEANLQRINQNQNLKLLLVKSQSKIQSLQNRLLSLQQDLHSLDVDKRQLQNQHSRLQDQLDSQNRTWQELKAKLELDNTDLRSSNSQMQVCVGFLHQLIGQLKHQKIQSEQHTQRLKDQFLQLKNQREVLFNKAASLSLQVDQARLSFTDTLKRQQLQFETEVGKARSGEERLRRELWGKGKEAQSLGREIERFMCRLDN